MTKLLTWIGAATAVSLSLLVAPSATAATIHTPPNGHVAAESESLLFDWAWDDDEYWTMAIIFTQNPDPDAPIWIGGPQAGKVRVTASYGSGWGESHAAVDLADWPLAPGVWYWRLCNQTIYGEDDKCYVDAEVRALTITEVADCSDRRDNDSDGKVDGLDPSCRVDALRGEAPDPQCSDRVDNDGDQDVDWALDDNCEGDLDNTEAPDPRPPAPSAERVEPLPRLRASIARSLIRKALRRRFGNVYRDGQLRRVRGCERVSKTRIRCRKVSWAVGDLGYFGRATIWYSRHPGGVRWNYSYRLKRTNYYCKDVTPERRCVKIHRVS